MVAFILSESFLASLSLKVDLGIFTGVHAVMAKNGTLLATKRISLEMDIPLNPAFILHTESMMVVV